MGINYNPSKWENGKTVIKASHFEKIEKGITDIINYNNSIYADEDKRKENEIKREEEHNKKIKEVNTLVDDLKSDYDSLEKIIIDENASANLQNQINDVNSQLAHIAFNSPFVVVEDFGAIGDGITDDTQAIQEAINYCSYNNLQLKLKGCRYKISNSLHLKSNIVIYGQQGCEIYFSACEDKVEKAIFYSDRQELRNVEIRNIKLVSENILQGSGYTAEDLVSYVQGISIYGGQNIRIIDVTMECMMSGLKFSKSATGYLSKNIYVNNLEVINSCTPVLLSHCENVVIENSVLDASASKSKYMHCIYSQKGMKNIRFDNIVCKNSPGGGIHLFQEGMSNYPVEERGCHYHINNLTTINCYTSMYLWNCDNITVSNMNIHGSINVFNFSDVTNVAISNIQAKTISGSVFVSTTCKNVHVSNGYIDCNDCEEPVLGNTHISADGLFIENIVFDNITQNILFCNANTYQDMTIKGCTFKINSWSGNEKISVRGANSKFLFINNTIYKNCEGGSSYLYYSPTSTNDVIIKDNTLYGPITHIKHPSGNYEYCAKSINNFFVDSHKFITD